MNKEFNITGTCVPEMHYMVDVSHKIDQIIKLIEKGRYFVINRPRQYGKTTTLFMLNKKLKSDSDYISIKISFEGLGDSIFESEELFVKTFIQIVCNNLRITYTNLSDFLAQKKENVNSLNDLSSVITDFIIKTGKKVVLMIDEVDKSSNNQLFLSFLGMLRNKYLLRNEGEDFSFQSVILAGVHDVKSLKLKIRPDEEKKYNSPWNIASDFKVDMSFSKEEIATMLKDYKDNSGVNLEIDYFSEKLYFYTSGYPFLVSKLCKIIDEDIMDKNSHEWNKDYLEKAIKQLLSERNTNFESLIKNIENNIKLNELVYKVIIDGSEITFNEDNPAIMLGITYGILKNKNGKLKIQNKIYEQRIYDYMSSLIETNTNVSLYNEKSNYINPNGTLNMKNRCLY